MDMFLDYILALIWFCFSFSFSFSISRKRDLFRVDSRKFLVTILFLFLFLFSFSIFWETGPFRERTVENFSSLFLFLFCFCFVSIFGKLDLFQSGQLKISRHYFVFFFFFFLLHSYLARDSSKKWQEIINKPTLISPDWTELPNFSSLYCFCFCFCFFIFGKLNHLQSGQLNISCHYFVFIFSLFFFSRGIVLKSDKKLYTSPIWFIKWYLVQPCLVNKNEKKIRLKKKL